MEIPIKMDDLGAKPPIFRKHPYPQVPSIRAEATVLWHLGDHWTEGPKRTVAMRQTHTVQLVQPSLGSLNEVVDMIYQMLL